jgi:hypothetical protein
MVYENFFEMRADQLALFLRPALLILYYNEGENIANLLSGQGRPNRTLARKILNICRPLSELLHARGLLPNVIPKKDPKCEAVLSIQSKFGKGPLRGELVTAFARLDLAFVTNRIQNQNEPNQNRPIQNQDQISQSEEMDTGSTALQENGPIQNQGPIPQLEEMDTGSTAMEVDCAQKYDEIENISGLPHSDGDKEQNNPDYVQKDDETESIIDSEPEVHVNPDLSVQVPITSNENVSSNVGTPNDLPNESEPEPDETINLIFPLEQFQDIQDIVIGPNIEAPQSLEISNENSSVYKDLVKQPPVFLPTSYLNDCYKISANCVLSAIPNIRNFLSGNYNKFHELWQTETNSLEFILSWVAVRNELKAEFKTPDELHRSQNIDEHFSWLTDEFQTELKSLFEIPIEYVDSCGHCTECKTTIQTQNMLVLNNNAITIQAMIDNYTELEQIEKRCDSCKEKGNIHTMTQKKTIMAASKYVILSLASPHQYVHTVDEKISINGTEFELVAIVVSQAQVHYYTMAKFQTGWYILDDQKEIEIEKINDKNEFIFDQRQKRAVLLMYCKVDEIENNAGNSIQKANHVPEDPMIVDDVEILQEEIVEEIPFKVPNLKTRKVSKLHSGSSIAKKGHVCKICEKAFDAPSKLKRHERTHTGEKPFKCEECGKGFAEKYMLTRHERTHTGEKPFKCEVCEKAFDTPSLLKSHERTHTGEKPFKCEECGKGFADKSNLTEHTKRHDNKKEYTCKTCNKGFNTQTELKRHQAAHSTDKNFICKICSKSYKTRDSCYKHIQKEHVLERWQCEYCQKLFKSKHILLEHIRVVHEKRFYCCDQCDRSFKYTQYFKEHMDFHKAGKFIECHLCDPVTEFESKAGYLIHIAKYHDPMKPSPPTAKCKYCQTEFMNSSCKNKHLRTCPFKPKYMDSGLKLKLDFYEDATIFDLYMPGMDGYANMAPEWVRLPRLAQPVPITDPRYRRDLSNELHRYIVHRNHIAHRCATTRRTNKVTTGRFDQPLAERLRGKARYTTRKFKPDPRIEKTKQMRPSIKDKFNKWVTAKAPYRIAKNGRKYMRHYDMIVYGHTLEHSLGGSSLLTSIAYHSWLANIQEIYAIEAFGKRLQKHGYTINITYGDLTRDQCYKYLKNQNAPTPFMSVGDDGNLCPISWASYRIIFAQHPDQPGEWQVFAFLHGQFGLTPNTSLRFGQIDREELTLEEHFARIYPNCVNPQVIMDLTGENLITTEQLAMVSSVNSLQTDAWDLCENREIEFNDPSQDHYPPLQNPDQNNHDNNNA